MDVRRRSSWQGTGGDPADQDGAVAIVVAILLVVLLGISAFAVDFGLAYTVKNQVQTAADAAAIVSLARGKGPPGGVFRQEHGTTWFPVMGPPARFPAA